MRRLVISILTVTILISGGWALIHKDQINNFDDAVRLAKSQLRSIKSEGLAKNVRWSVDQSRQTDREKSKIRIASFNVRAFGEKKSNQPVVMSQLARIVREFDVVAIQEIRSPKTAVLQELVNQVNSTGAKYSVVVSNPIGRTTYREQYAFVYDTESIQLDSSHTYVVNDPDDLLHREPLVGWFRCKNAELDRAFTFSLVNVHLDSRQPEAEIQYIGKLFRAIRNDGRGEDDIVIAGDFNANDQNLAQLREKAGLECLLVGVNTNTRATKQYDNFLIDPRATGEFTGRSGVYDFLKAFNLTIEQAIEISDHLPIWAEYSVIEGDVYSQTASRKPTLPEDLNSTR